MKASERSSWRLQYFVPTAIVAVFLSLFISHCLCYIGAFIGQLRLELRFVMLTVIALRVCAAWYRKEKSRGWIAYHILLLCTPLIVDLICYAVLAARYPEWAEHAFMW
jgi:hypothetical protein